MQALRYLLNGPNHLVKNYACALRSARATLHIGRYWVDTSSTLDLALPAGCFTGYDEQSDLEAATLLSGGLAMYGFAVVVSPK